RIVKTAETCPDSAKFEHPPELANTEDSISRSSYHIAKEIGAAAIITPTWSGSTASLVSRFRPKQLILATTPNEQALDFMALSWGVLPLKIPNANTIDELIRFSIDAARKAGYLHAGEQVIVTGGVPLHVAGKTNFIKVESVE